MLRDAKQYEWLHEFEFLFAGTTAPDAAAAKAAEAGKVHFVLRGIRQRRFSLMQDDWDHIRTYIPMKLREPFLQRVRITTFARTGLKQSLQFLPSECFAVEIHVQLPCVFEA